MKKYRGGATHSCDPIEYPMGHMRPMESTVECTIYGARFFHGVFHGVPWNTMGHTMIYRGASHEVPWGIPWCAPDTPWCAPQGILLKYSDLTKERGTAPPKKTCPVR